MQDCSNSIANALELLQFCTKSSICTGPLHEGFTVILDPKLSIIKWYSRGQRPTSYDAGQGILCISWLMGWKDYNFYVGLCIVVPCHDRLNQCHILQYRRSYEIILVFFIWLNHYGIPIPELSFLKWELIQYKKIDVIHKKKLSYYPRWKDTISLLRYKRVLLVI